MADDKNNKVEVVNSNTPQWLQPAAGSILPQWAIITLTVLVVIAGVVMLIPGLPPAVHAVAGGIVALGSAFGIASPGIRRAVHPPELPPNSNERPRVGPPAP
jgi:hypothetical protein